MKDRECSVACTTALPISLTRRLEEFCAANNVSKSLVLREAAQDWLDRECPDVDKPINTLRAEFVNEVHEAMDRKERRLQRNG